MALVADDAVVLRRLDYSESSLILVLFSRAHGKVRCIAKGVKRGTRKRFAVGIDLLEVGRAVWSARPDRQHRLSIISEWKQTAGYSGLRDHLDSIYAGLYAAEITSEATEDSDPHPELFAGLVGLLGQLCGDRQALVATCDFQRRLLHEVGLMPRADRCLGCRGALSLEGDRPFYFISQHGGVVCRDCEGSYHEKRRITGRAAAALAGDPIAPLVAGEVFDVLNYHIAQVIHKQPRLARFLLPAKRLAPGSRD